MGGRSKLALLGLLMLLVIGLLFHRKSEPHSVTLTWNAPQPRTGVTVVGYNIYRSAGEADSFVKLASRVQGPPYEDRLVSSGRTYSYVVTAVGQDGRESRFSAPTNATIP